MAFLVTLVSYEMHLLYSIIIAILIFILSFILSFLGVIENQFSIIFDNVENASNTLDDKGKIITEEQLILFKVDVQDPPIYIKNNIIDFNCVFFNRMYRKKIEIFNKSNTANKIEINVPKTFAKFLEISPSTIFIQAKDSQIVNIKFIPTMEMLVDLSYFSSLQEGFLNCATLFLPIEIQVILFLFNVFLYLFIQIKYNEFVINLSSIFNPIFSKLLIM